VNEKVSDWCKRGKVRFSQLYSGQLDLAKGITGKWEWLIGKLQQVISDTVNGYGPEVVDKLREAHINTFHVTFSNGFGIKGRKTTTGSPATSRREMSLLRY